MKKILILFGLSIFCSTLFFSFYLKEPSSKIITTSRFETIEKYLKDVDKDTLIIFDVDDVLITQSDHIFLASRREYFKNIVKELRNRYSKEDFETLISIIMLESPVQILEPKIVPFIDALQSKNVRVIALTALSTKSFKNNLTFIDWRINELKSMGISFRDCWSHIHPKEFLNFEVNHPPAFKDGILFSSGVPKEKVLHAFLQDIHLSPKKIIFIDDNRENIEAMKKYCNDSEIPYLGFEFTAAQELSPEFFDKIRAELQVYVLEHELTWLNDDKATQRLQDSALQTAF